MEGKESGFGRVASWYERKVRRVRREDVCVYVCASVCEMQCRIQQVAFLNSRLRCEESTLCFQYVPTWLCCSCP